MLCSDTVKCKRKYWSAIFPNEIIACYLDFPTFKVILLQIYILLLFTLCILHVVSVTRFSHFYIKRKALVCISCLPFKTKWHQVSKQKFGLSPSLLLVFTFLVYFSELLNWISFPLDKRKEKYLLMNEMFSIFLLYILL